MSTIAEIILAEEKRKERSFLVAERGPELFIPRAHGIIVPNYNLNKIKLVGRH